MNTADYIAYRKEKTLRNIKIILNEYLSSAHKALQKDLGDTFTEDDWNDIKKVFIDEIFFEAKKQL